MRQAAMTIAGLVTFALVSPGGEAFAAADQPDCEDAYTSCQVDVCTQEPEGKARDDCFASCDQQHKLCLESPLPPESPSKDVQPPTVNPGGKSAQ
jgi:hypothetical protein